jgi:hypothetical protein
LHGGGLGAAVNCQRILGNERTDVGVDDWHGVSPLKKTGEFTRNQLEVLLNNESVLAEKT